MEMNCGEEDMMKSSPAPEVTVRVHTAVFEAELALTSKFPPGMSAGIVTWAFQVLSPAI